MTQTASDSTIDALLKEGRTFPPSEEFRAQANVRDDSLYREAEADSIALRVRGAGKKQEAMSVADFLARIEDELATRALKP